jgi:hypothetical protein
MATANYAPVAGREDDARTDTNSASPLPAPSPATAGGASRSSSAVLLAEADQFTPLSLDGSDLQFEPRPFADKSTHTDPVSPHDPAQMPTPPDAAQSSPRVSAQPFGAATAARKPASAGRSLAPPTTSKSGHGYGLLSPAPSWSGISDVSNRSSLASSPALLHAPSPLEEGDLLTSEQVQGLPGSVTSAGPRDASDIARLGEDRNLLSNEHTQIPTINSNATRPARPIGSDTSSQSSTVLIRPKPRSVQTGPLITSDISDLPNPKRRASAAVPIRHPVPDLNTRSGAYAGNIATLEATAEAFSMTSSIEDAIRDAHEKLKRSDSQRSSILAASVRKRSLEGEDPNSPPGSGGLAGVTVSRQSSILDTYNAARHGGYSPAAYVMSPTHSFSSRSTRLRAGSKSSANGSFALPVMDSTTADFGNGEDFPWMSRSGPGKSSVRSVLSTRSGKVTLPEIVETEPPVTITQAALDEADRLAAEAPDEEEEDDTIRGNAQQRTSVALDPEMDLGMELDTPLAEGARPILDTAGLQLHEPETVDKAAVANAVEDVPATPTSLNTTDPEAGAFVDFDGVHYDPDQDKDLLAMPDPGFPQMPSPDLRPRRDQLPAAPSSYFDPATGRQMLYYPAPVPAMLTLPRKLGKNNRASQMNIGRSKVMSAMPEMRNSRMYRGSQALRESQAIRDSQFILPDPLQGVAGSPLIDSKDNSGTNSIAERPRSSQIQSEAQAQQLDPALPSPASASFTAEQPRQSIQPHRPETLRLPARLTDNDKRKSRMSLLPGGLAPELRASVFFDAPDDLPEVEVKDGSAMATLDSILDAAATAPVNAFTDHVYAGKLGDEVYGTAKKTKKQRSSQMPAHARSESRADDLANLDPKKRASLFSLLGGGKRQSSALGAVNGETGRQTAMSSRTGLGLDGAESIREDAEHDEEPEDDGEESSSDEEAEPTFTGAPTTLLAELQLRKQQAKLRTRPVYKIAPNGLHSTLLELDAVAEVERKTRKGRRVNLAWEDPMMRLDEEDDDYDDDVPLGMLYAAKKAGHNDLREVIDEVNRPLGLLERRDMEENEPLSKRRDRLQGREPAVSAKARLSRLNLPDLSANARHSRMDLPMTGGLRPISGIAEGSELGAEAPLDEPEIEEETLGERMRRLRAQNEDPAGLPKARPVSGAFSAELLSQFGGDGDSQQDGPSSAKDKGKGTETIRLVADKENDPPATEEEETLGQRRKRLQAEKEAREREMASAGPSYNPSALNALSGGSEEQPRLSRRLSLADVLGAHAPLKVQMAAAAVSDAERERIEHQEKAARFEAEKAAKMAAFRAAVPTVMPGSGVGTGRVHGGFLGGRFNDGTAGGLGYNGGLLNHSASMGNMAAGYGQGGMTRSFTNPAIPMHSPTANMYNPNANYAFGGQQQGMGMPMGMPYGNPYGSMSFGPGYPAAGGFGAMPMNMQMPMQGAMGMGMNINMQGGQPPVDMVERWRQSIVP